MLENSEEVAKMDKSLLIHMTSRMYELLRKVAYEEHISLAEIVRAAIGKTLNDYLQKNNKKYVDKHNNS